MVILYTLQTAPISTDIFKSFKITSTSSYSFNYTVHQPIYSICNIIANPIKLPMETMRILIMMSFRSSYFQIHCGGQESWGSQIKHWTRGFRIKHTSSSQFLIETLRRRRIQLHVAEGEVIVTTQKLRSQTERPLRIKPFTRRLRLIISSTLTDRRSMYQWFTQLPYRRSCTNFNAYILHQTFIPKHGNKMTLRI